MSTPPDELCILSIDTSLPVLSVALTRGEQTAGTIALEGKFSRNEKLLPSVDWLLQESGTARTEIDLFAVTRGPGSFTGVRVGLATVQGLALSLRRPVCAISTHSAVAEAAPGDEAVLIVSDAGRGEFYATVYRGLDELLEPRLMSKEDISRTATEFPRRLSVEEFVSRGNVALLAARRARRIVAADLLAGYGDLAPIYVRLAEAEARLGQKSDG